MGERNFHTGSKIAEVQLEFGVWLAFYFYHLHSTEQKTGVQESSLVDPGR